jgi:hypothetical protein
MILIGSSAIRHYYPEFKRVPKDIDYVVNSDSKMKSADGIEYLINPVIYKRYAPFVNTVISANDLTTLKASHLLWNINWGKHMFDLQFLLSKGHKINEDLFFRLYDQWNVLHSKNKRSDLKMSKEDFFDNAINYNESEHDDLHKIINPNPIYTRILKDGEEVELCELKYQALTRDEKLDLVREEVMVMAYERYRRFGYKIAYVRMLKKFIISHAPIFTLIFILENYVELLKPKTDFIKTIENELTTTK